MRYRSRTDIMYTIMQAALKGTNKTRIMQKAYLSFKQLQDYLPFMITNGYLILNEKKKIYKTTEKGRSFLKMYGAFQDSFNMEQGGSKENADSTEVGNSSHVIVH